MGKRPLAAHRTQRPRTVPLVRHRSPARAAHLLLGRLRAPMETAYRPRLPARAGVRARSRRVYGMWRRYRSPAQAFSQARLRRTAAVFERLEAERALAPQPLGCGPLHPRGRRWRRMRLGKYAHALLEMPPRRNGRTAATPHPESLMCKPFVWKLKTRELKLGERTFIMGVLNVTPDSFSDGGKYMDPDRAFARAIELEEQGADIIDVGAESTRPGSERISAAEENRRLIPVLKRLRGKLTVPVSVDTYKAEVAELAIEHGAAIITDPSALTFDPQLAKIVVQNDDGLIVNHMRGRPETWAKLPPMRDVIGTIARELEATVNRARHAGVDRSRIVIDPGIGFGKRKEQNSEILAQLGKLAGLD